MLGIASMPSSALHLAQEFLKRQVAGEDVLTDREQGQLDVLHGAMDGTVLLPPDPRTPEDAYIAPDAGYPKQEATDATTIDEPTAAAEPICEYCHRKCVGPAHDGYSVLHWNDPIEIKKRDEKATAEMFESMRRARTGEPRASHIDEPHSGGQR